MRRTLCPRIDLRPPMPDGPGRGAWRMRVAAALLLGALIAVPAWTQDDDERAPAPAPGNSALPELSPEQSAAVGITVVHPLKARAAAQIEGYGEVLDAAALIADA